MTWSLLDGRGQRKYLTANERIAFINVARKMEPSIGTFCLTIALTGARISEVLALTADRVDVAYGAVVIETLKRRQRGVFRAVPVPAELVNLLCSVHGIGTGPEFRSSKDRLWDFSRTTAWKHVKHAMQAAGILSSVAKPKSLRHAFAIEAVRQRIALSVVKKWLGHARIETTAIYADPIGDEERALARLMWQELPPDLFEHLP